ncbi:CPBP family intramembrane glutamic endopeptidase [Tessaracoccus sp.]
MTINSGVTTRATTREMDPPATKAPAVQFHRLGHSAANHRWWRPPLVGVIAAALYVAAFLLLMVLLAIVGVAFPRMERVMDTFMQDADVMDVSDPFMFAFAMGMLILLIPALFLATRIAGAGPVGRLSSVVGRLRWRWLLRCGMVALCLYAVGHSVSLVVAVAQGSSWPGVLDVPRALVLLVLTFTLVPLQCAAEEYLFRGYLMQAIGSWLRHPAFAILLPVPLFVLGHEYGLLGMTDVAVFAIAAGWLTWRTGGVEAALALHVVGNVSGFALGAVGLVDIGATDIGWGGLVVSVLMTMTFALLVLRLARRHDIERTAPASQ